MSKTEKAYACTYTIHPDINPEEATPVGDPVKVKADNRKEAGLKALRLPIPEGADPLQVHVCPLDNREDAGFEVFDEEDLAA